MRDIKLQYPEKAGDVVLNRLNQLLFGVRLEAESPVTFAA